MAQVYKGCTCGQYKFDPNDDLSAHHRPQKKDFIQAFKVMKVPNMSGKSPEDKKEILRKARETWMEAHYHPYCHHDKEYRRNARRMEQVYKCMMIKWDKEIMMKGRHKMAAVTVNLKGNNPAKEPAKDIEVIDLESDKEVTTGKPST